MSHMKPKYNNLVLQQLTNIGSSTTSMEIIFIYKLSLKQNKIQIFILYF